MHELQNLHPKSTAKTLALLAGIFALLFSLLVILQLVLTSRTPYPGSVNFLQLLALPLLFPLINAVIGAFIGFILAIAYNLLARRFGGFKFTLKDLEK